MRRANVAATQNAYINTVDADAAAAMRSLERSLENAPNMHLESAKKSPVM